MSDIEGFEYDAEKAKEIIDQYATDFAPSPQYHTVGQLQALIAKRDGKPCKSRNRKNLLRLAGLPDVPRPAEMKHDGRLPGSAPRVAKKAPALRHEGKGTRTVGVGKRKPPKASKKTAPKKAAKRAPTGEKKPKKAPTAAIIRSDADRHAEALAFVVKAMKRKDPPALRPLCRELDAAKVKKPRGKGKWWPSSVQNLMRQAGYDAGGKAGVTK